MDRMLADILRDQCNLGNKNDGGWKSIAYNTVAFALSTQFKVSILGDNAKYRIKLWKKWYEISHKDANCFRFKLIPNLDDIVDLCAKDRATGHGVETTIDDNDIMSSELKDEKNSEECEVDCLGGV
ncbi:hypothetical protein CRYUN_Cryun17cG0085000 [Craigia yunnanensis]